MRAVAVCGGKKIFSILPYQDKKVGIVTTGSEVYHGRIQDAFGPVLKEKVKEFGGEVMGQTITDDDRTTQGRPSRNLSPREPIWCWLAAE